MNKALKSQLLLFTISFIIVLFGIHIFTYSWTSFFFSPYQGDRVDKDASLSIEGFDTNTNTNTNGEDTKCTQATISTLVYKNAGAIENLKSSMNQIMEQVNKLIISSDKQTNQIQNINSLQDKYEKIANEADQIAQANKLRLLQMTKEAQQKAQTLQSQASKLQSP